MWFDLSVILVVACLGAQALSLEHHPVSRSHDTNPCQVSIGDQTYQGFSTPCGGCRYSIKYAQTSERWGYSKIVDTLAGQNFSALPPQCPQDSPSYVDGGNQSEDCLYAVVYTPGTVPFGSSLPVFVWIHGGSFIAGGASAPGLDGSALASAGNIIVVVLQYRLGVLGFLPPQNATSAKDGNLGFLDVINGLIAIQGNINYLGGDKDKITIGGQSSGAGIIRALLGSPAAKGLFRAGILQSDPMFYGFASPNITAQLQSAFYQANGTACKDLKCWQSMPIDKLLDAQAALIQAGPAIPGVPIAEVLRPTFGTDSLPQNPTSLIASSPSSLTYNPENIPLLITTTKNEGGSVVQSIFPQAVPASNGTYLLVLAQLVGAERAAALAKSSMYSARNFPTDSDGFRELLEKVITDGIWRCANRNFAEAWGNAKGKVWVGEWRQGVTYPGNTGGSYCTAEGRVCHEDDIIPTFATALNADRYTTSFAWISRYWISFIITENPNPEPTYIDKIIDFFHVRGVRQLRPWKRYSKDSGSFVLGFGGDEAVTTCPDGFWGDVVPFDWQVYG